jgi:putative ABC transport system permease protein
MTTATLRGLWGRKLRAGLTTLAVLLGVALMAGSYVLTDTINASFDDIFQETSKGVDVAVVPKETVERMDGEPPGFPASLLERVRSVEGVALAEGSIFDDVSILGDDGEPIQTEGAPNLAASVQREPFNPFDYVEGRAPQTDQEVAVDSFTSDRKGFEVGETLRVVGERGAQAYRITGIAKLGEVESFGGASLAVMTLPEAQEATGKEGKFDEISIAAEDGVSAQVLKRRVSAVMPATVEVRTGQENADIQSQDTADDLGFLKTALLIFAFIALFVGAFTIFNTFSITVAQRSREFGLLRTLGASRRQVLTSVVLEALLIGLVGSVLGLFAGLGVAAGIGELFKSVGIDLPNTGTVVATRTIVVSLIVGSLVTFLAALAPAVRATRVSPMEALQESAAPSRRRRPVVLMLAAVLGVIGIGLLVYGLFGGIEDGDAAAGLVGLGAVAIFFAVALLSPQLVRPLASAVGKPIERLRGVSGRLARENSTRNPGRTAATAAALMIGLALVSFVTVFAAGLKASIDNSIDDNFAGDLTLQNKDGFSPIPAQAGREVAALDGVEVASPIRFDESKVEGTSGNHFMAGIDPASLTRVFNIEWEEGSNATLLGLGPNGAILDEGFAGDEDFEVGETMRVVTPTGRRVTYDVRGTFKDRTDFFGDYAIRNSTLVEDFDTRKDGLVLVKLEAGANIEAASASIDRLLERRFATVESLDQQELKDSIASQIDQLVALLYALLSLAVIVSLFGIVNTLALAIYERTRELGLLRAIGMSRRQVRRVVRYEAVITALIGAVIGAVLGLFFAVVISRPLADEGFVLSFPVATLIILLILAALAGVLAAILPARRASRLDVLEALAYE